MTQYKPSVDEKDTFGTMVAASYFGEAILNSALYGIQFFMVLSILSSFFNRSKEGRKGHLRYVVISCVILVTFSVDTVLGIWKVFRILFAGGPSPQSYLPALFKVNEKGRVLNIAGDAMLVVTITVSDVVMIWRCLILWNHKKWVVLLPFLTFVGTIVSHIAYLVFTSTTDVARQIFTVKAMIAAASLSVAMNIMVTFLILLRLTLTWLHTSKAFSDRKTPRMYLDPAVILIEAAVPLTVFGIGMITTLAITTSDSQQIKRPLPQGRLHVLNVVFASLYYSFCALSPQMIIYRVAAGRSWKDTAESQAGGANISQPIQFARTAGEGSVGRMSSDRV
ncbi:hypothetical protein BKA70DRAFT_1184900 [Coprinopsis sp. MPI-PUGE-AT-0042]|nr:hypothetical protein BKA70DRAFT_1184900 [Coprinopsis sp. MPI-PUGE-AT-0042]